MSFKSALVRATLFSLSACPLFLSEARAQPVDGWYSAGGIGLNTIRNEKITKAATPFGDQPGGDIRARDGYALIGSVGWGFGNGFRVEGEGGFRRNELYQATAGSLMAASADGSENKSSLFINGFYEFDRPFLGISPYIGAGIGYNWIKWKNLMVFNDVQTVRFNDTQVKLSYQGIVGFSFLKNLVRGMSITAEYRIQGLDGDRAHHGEVLRSRFGAFHTSATVTDSLNQSFMLGIRFQVPPGGSSARASAYAR